MPTVLELRRTSLASDLAGIVTEAEQMMGRDDFDPDSQTYTALRENREQVEGQLADVTGMIAARNLAADPAPVATVGGQEVSAFRRILREFDRGHSDRVDVDYTLLREVLMTGDPLLTPNPTRIAVEQLPIITPTLDSIRAVQTGNAYDFLVPPPPVLAVTVAEGAAKPAVTFESALVEGKLETDAHILDVTRQTLEDDAAAERTLRSWLTEGVRLKQDAKAAAAIAGATGTQTATGTNMLFSIRKGKAELSKLGITATAVYLNPDDAATIDIDAMTNGHTGPVGQNLLWGMRPIENPGIAAGTAIVGAMPQAVYLCYRAAISTYLTDSGMTVETTPRDRFSHNILGILGEGRSKVHVVQPKLLVRCTVAPVVP